MYVVALAAAVGGKWPQTFHPTRREKKRGSVSLLVRAAILAR
jgi:hypothetical protein